MNEKEKRDFYIAMCRCCLIADAMKTCPLCHFKVGLAEQMVMPVISLSLPTHVQIATFVLPE